MNVGDRLGERWARTKFSPEPKQKFPHRLLHWFLSSSLVPSTTCANCASYFVLNILCIVPFINFCISNAFLLVFQRSFNSAQDQQGPLQAFKLVALHLHLEVALRYPELNQFKQVKHYCYPFQVLSTRFDSLALFAGLAAVMGVASGEFRNNCSAAASSAPPRAPAGPTQRVRRLNPMCELRILFCAKHFMHCSFY